MGLSIGMAVYNMQQQQDMANQQQSANDQWVAYQRRQSQEFQRRDEELRKNAEAGREGALDELTAQKQTAAQENEAARLKTALTPDDIAKMADGDPNALASKMLSGQSGGSEYMQRTIQAQLKQAAIESRKRIAALAEVQSYGGSQFGLTNRANSIFNAAGQDIRLSGNERSGALAAYNVAKAVEPIKIAQYGGGSGLGGMSSSLAGASGGGLGNAMAAGMQT
jgi:hypothetical protein